MVHAGVRSVGPILGGVNTLVQKARAPRDSRRGHRPLVSGRIAASRRRGMAGGVARARAVAAV